jgi:hypothetical protein
MITEPREFGLSRYSLGRGWLAGHGVAKSGICLVLGLLLLSVCPAGHAAEMDWRPLPGDGQARVEGGRLLLELPGVAETAGLRTTPIPVTIHNNVFLNKSVGISFRMPTRLGPMAAYRNTFVNCGYGQNEAGDVGDWINTEAEVSNNLYYHFQPGQKFYDLQTNPWNKLNSDYNLFFSTTGQTAWKHLYQRRATTLAGWQQYSGRDSSSLWKDPRFVNPDGRRPEDFKRKGQAEAVKDVQGSRYGPVCGAYATGEVSIGLLPDQGKRH